MPTIDICVSMVIFIGPMLFSMINQGSKSGRFIQSTSRNMRPSFTLTYFPFFFLRFHDFHRPLEMQC